MVERAALPLFATTIPAKVGLLALVPQMIGVTKTRIGNPQGDTWGKGPFNGSMRSYAPFKTVAYSLGVEYSGNGHGDPGCQYCPGGELPLYGALFEVGEAPATRYVLTAQPTWAVRLHFDVRAEGEPGLWARGVQIAPDDITSMRWQPPAAVRPALVADLTGAPARDFWVAYEEDAAFLDLLAQDLPGLLSHMTGTVAPSRPGR